MIESSNITPWGRTRKNIGSAHISEHILDLTSNEQKMIKLFIVLQILRDHRLIALDLGKKFGSEQADSLTPIKRPNFGLNTQDCD